MRPFLFAAAIFSLSGCIDATALASHNVEVRVHRSLPASGVTGLQVENIAGAIAVSAWDRPSVDVRALTYGADKDSVDRTHVVVVASGSQISVKTEYDSTNNFFGGQNGAEVDYTIRVPKSVNVDITNISGPTTIEGVAGNVDATEVSGRLDANLGALSGTRRVTMSAVSGRITARIARGSDARVEASTLSGPVDFFFPADKHQGYVGTSATGQLGKGTSSMTLHTVSGPIAVEPE
jgi:DUF4097 and DUF4098 domain-containing protein YvlB